MVRSFAAPAIAGVLLSSVAYAEGGFRRDVDYSSLSQVLSSTTISELAVGDSAYIASWHLCWQDNELRVVAIHEIDDRSDYSANLRITRLAGGTTELEIELGERADASSVVSLVKRLARDVSCEDTLSSLAANPDSVPLLEVRSINGFTSLTDLASSFDEPETATSKEEPDKPQPEADIDLGWFVTEESDEITDQPNVFITKFATKQVPGRFGRDWTPMIAFRCTRNTSSVVISVEDYMVADRIPVSYRFDDSAAESGRWSVAASRKAIGLWSGRNSIPFLKRVAASDTLTIRVETGDGIYTFDFDLADADTHITKLAKACNWSL